MHLIQRTFRKLIDAFDVALVHTFRRFGNPLARASLFIVFVWFGVLKVNGNSPAIGLVQKLFSETMLSGLNFEAFLVVFGFYEMLTGILFVLPRTERLAIAFLIPHMVTTALPLFLFPQETWQLFLVPTLEGQYIIKNLVLIAVAIGIAGHLRPLRGRLLRR